MQTISRRTALAGGGAAVALTSLITAPSIVHSAQSDVALVEAIAAYERQRALGEALLDKANAIHDEVMAQFPEYRPPTYWEMLEKTGEAYEAAQRSNRALREAGHDKAEAAMEAAVNHELELYRVVIEFPVNTHSALLKKLRVVLDANWDGQSWLGLNDGDLTALYSDLERLESVT
jgi:hypothetical protein